MIKQYERFSRKLGESDSATLAAKANLDALSQEYADSSAEVKKPEGQLSIPFTYIKKNYGSDQYDNETAIMEVDVDWDESTLGYSITHHVPDMHLIDPAEGNGTEDDFWEDIVYIEVKDKLEAMGISVEALSWGGLWT